VLRHGRERCGPPCPNALVKPSAAQKRLRERQGSVSGAPRDLCPLPRAPRNASSPGDARWRGCHHLGGTGCHAPGCRRLANPTAATNRLPEPLLLLRRKRRRALPRSGCSCTGGDEGCAPGRIPASPCKRYRVPVRRAPRAHRGTHRLGQLCRGTGQLPGQPVGTAALHPPRAARAQRPGPGRAAGSRERAGASRPEQRPRPSACGHATAAGALLQRPCSKQEPKGNTE